MSEIQDREIPSSSQTDTILLIQTKAVDYDSADELTSLDTRFGAIQISGTKLGDFIRSSTQAILAPMNDLDLDEISIEFCVGVEGEKGVPLIVSAKGSASIKVTAKWTRDKS